ncbi:MAG: CRISPR system precrRNA processing endoribonuclease RAMP protein Cas6 [Mycobacteriaceae bacterium]
MLTRWLVPVGGVDPDLVKLDYVHAVACAWLDSDHWGSHKPWSVSPLRVVDGVAVLEVCTLNNQAEQLLLSRVAANSAVRFGSQSATILGEPQVMQQLQWGQFLSAPVAKVWSVDFLTPTTFRYKQRSSPWPDPRTVARSLSEKWNELSPKPIPQIKIDREAAAQHLWVRDIDGCSQVLPLAKMMVSGFVGRVSYACDDPAVAAQFGALLAFAEFAGIGSSTTKGLGVTRINTDQQRLAAAG